MKRLFILLVFASCLFLISGQVKVQAVDCTTTRCATCDLCGYCPSAATIPSNWEVCRNCLYPSLTGTPAKDNQTLIIDENENTGPTPNPGSWYTMFGCVQTNLGGFTQQGAAGSVVQVLLNTIFGIAGGIAFLYILYGSFIILTSQADPERLYHGKRVVYGAIVGLIFSLSAVFLVNLIGGKILNIPGFGGSPTPTPSTP